MKPTYILVFALAICCANATRVQSQQPDLVLAVPNAFWEDAFWGGVQPYQFNLTNLGDAAATGGFTIKSYLSLDDVRSSDDVQDGTITTGNLLAGQSVNNVQGALTVPIIAEGWYHLLLVVDADEQIAESNENNNVVVAGYLHVQNPNKPNLSCSVNFANLSNVNALQVVAQANNLSNWPVVDSFDLVLYRASNGQPLDKVKVGPLPAWGAYNHTFNALLAPQDLSGFMFDFVAAVDLSDSINELKEDDNYTYQSISIPTGQVLPDYGLSVVTPLALNGETITFQHTISNVGGGTAPAGTMSIAMRKDSSFSWFARYPLGSVSFPALAAGQSYVQTLNLPLPPNPLTGHYFLELVAGDDLNDTNNMLLVPFDFVSPFVQPERLFLGEMNAMRVRQNSDLSFTVLLKTQSNPAKAFAAHISPQGDVLAMVELADWGAQTIFSGDGYMTVGSSTAGQVTLISKNAQGAVLWEKSHPVPQSTPLCVTPTHDGGFLVGGAITINNPVGPPSNLPLLLRTDTEGNEIWRRTTGPAAGIVTQLEALPSGDFGAAMRYNGYFEQKYGVEVCRISPDGTQYHVIESDLASYQGAFSMQVNAVRGAQDSTVYFAMNHWDVGKWTNFLSAYFGKSPGWKNAAQGCQGVCVPTGIASADMVVPAMGGGVLVGGSFSSDYHGYHLQMLDNQGNVLWNRPYPNGVKDGIQAQSGGFALCGNEGNIAYFTLIEANGNPALGNCLTDTEPPQLLNCPPNDTVITVDLSAYATWTPPTAVDNCGTMTLSSTHQPGGNLAIGEHVVLYTATDAQGNTATCSHTVWVQQVPCAVSYAGAFCNDNQTPDLPNDDILTLYLNVSSADALTWAGVLDVQGLSPMVAPFNTDYSQDFSFQAVEPYLLDGTLVLQIEGQNGNLCNETIVLNFDSTDYCVSLIKLADIQAESIFLVKDTLLAGDPFAFGYGLRNRGNWGTPDPVGLEIRIAKDTLPSANDWVVFSNYPFSLPANDTMQLGDIVLQTSSGLPEGHYWLWLTADPSAQIHEFDETNNSVKVPIYVLQPVGAVSPEQPMFALSPNPASTFVDIHCPMELRLAAVALRLHNSSGQVVLDKMETGAAHIRIPMAELSEGAYVVEIRHDLGIWRGKLVKKRG